MEKTKSDFQLVSQNLTNKIHNKIWNTITTKHRNNNNYKNNSNNYNHCNKQPTDNNKTIKATK